MVNIKQENAATEPPFRAGKGVCSGVNEAVKPQSTGDGTRTRKPVKARDFKSLVYTIPPLRRGWHSPKVTRNLGLIWVETKNAARRQRFLFWSGGRGSNSRPRPWQGRALPTELLSLEVQNKFRCAEWCDKGRAIFWRCKYQVWKFPLLWPFYFIFRPKNLTFP